MLTNVSQNYLRDCVFRAALGHCRVFSNGTRGAISWPSFAKVTPGATRIIKNGRLVVDGPPYFCKNTNRLSKTK